MYQSSSIISIKITTIVYIIRQVGILYRSSLGIIKSITGEITMVSIIMQVSTGHRSSFTIIKMITKEITTTLLKIMGLNSISNPGLLFKINTHWEVA